MKQKPKLLASFTYEFEEKYLNNVKYMKKFNPDNESFSFSENDLPSNLNIENDEDDDQN